MPAWAFTPAAKWCFTKRHLGHEIGGFGQLRLGIATGDDDMKTRPALAQRSDDGVQVEILIAKRNIELVEDHEPECRLRHQLQCLCPGALGSGDVALDILRLPGKALAHGMPGDLLPERGERVALRRVPCALDELHNADAMAAAEHAQREAEGCSGFSLAGAGMHDEKALLHRLARDLGILHRLALCHLGAVTFCLGFLDRFGHGLPFKVSGNPATTRKTRSARAAIR